MMNEGFLLGLDIGSSSVKASLVSVASGQTVVTARAPEDEMTMIAAKPGWAEQDPEMWWRCSVMSIRKCLQDPSAVSAGVVAIGIAYQMHGLVVVGHDQKPLRNSIIWCDSRAASLGDQAFIDLGEEHCLSHLLNSPGNFTASKLKWVQKNEPATYQKIFKAMLPGDYIAMKLTGDISTTDTGLSEGVFWDFKTRSIASELTDYYGIDLKLLGAVVPVFSVHGMLTKQASGELGLREGIPISYRSGDQPNNAFSLNVLEPGETAATAGTSGVIYSVTDQNAFDTRSRINTFIHVNNSAEKTRNGVLLCVNGTGSQNSWLRRNVKGEGEPFSYSGMNVIASKIPIGSDGVTIMPFGNGSERIFENKNTTGSIHGLNFNTHHQGHIFRAAQEGIVFALRYGFEILNEMGLTPTVIKAGNANMFLSAVFREAFANAMGVPVLLFDTDGSKGAALGAGLGAGIFSTPKEAFRGLHHVGEELPTKTKSEQYDLAYARWKSILEKEVS